MADIKVGFRADQTSLTNILNEIQKTVGEGLKDLSVSIKEIDLGNTAKQFADSLNDAMSKIDFSKSLNIGDALTGTNTALSELTAQIKDVKVSIDQLNTSFNSIGKYGAAGIEAIISSMRELNSLVQQINSKDFSITNMMTYQSGGAGNSGLALYRDQARELIGVLGQLRSAMDQIGQGTMGKVYVGLKQQFAELESMDIDGLSKRIGSKTVAGLQSMIDEAQRYKRAMEEIITTSTQLGANVALPDMSAFDTATRKVAEFEQRGRQVEQTFIDAAEATTKMSRAAAAVDGSQQQMASATSGTRESLASIKTMCDEIGVSFDTLRDKINNTFDFTKPISSVAELKKEIDELGTSLGTMTVKLERMNRARITDEQKSQLAAQNSILSSETSTTKSAYDSMLRGGYNDAEANAIKQRYTEWLAEIKAVQSANAIATQEQMAHLQSEADAVRQAIAAYKQKAAEIEAAAKQSEGAAEREAKAQERAAAAAQNAAIREANLQKQTANMRSRVSNYINTNTKAYQLFGAELDSILSELSKEGGVSRERLSQLATEFTNIQTAAKMAGASGQTFFQKLQAGWQKFGGWALVTKSFMQIINGFKKMIAAVKDLDLAMTELKKVTDLTAAGYAKFYQQAAAAAKTVGASVSDTINATADFARLGYNVSDALSLAEAGLMYKNVGDGINDISQATESLISTIKAFDYESENAMRIVDQFNEVGNNFAISSTGIGDALARSASALAGSNNTLEESIGLITAANAIVQNPDSVGTAMKTLTMYLRAAKTELEEAGESSEGCAESVSKLRSELKSLTGVDIMLDENTFKSTYQIIKEISEVWEDLSDATRANVTGLIAGKRNANVVQALMTNFEDAEAAMETAANSAGSALIENEKYLDSIAGRLSLLKAQFEELSQSLIGSDAVKWVISLVTQILSLATALSKVHVLLPAIAVAINAITGRGLAKDVMKIVSQTQMLIQSGTSVQGVVNTLSTAMAGLSAKQKALLINQLENIAGNEAVSAGYAEQIREIIALISADTGLTAANHGVAASFKSVMASIPVWGWVALAISTVVSVLEAVIPKITETRDKSIETANSLIKDFSDANDTYRKNAKTLDGLKDRFNELSKGVNENGENIGLTKTEYEEYQSIIQQLIDISPGIVTSYDDQGRAILDYKNALHNAIEEQNKYIENQRNIYLGSGDSIFSGKAEDYKKAAKSLGDAGKKLAETLVSERGKNFWGLTEIGTKQSDAVKKALQEVIGLSAQQAGDMFVGASNSVNWGANTEALQRIHERAEEFKAYLKETGAYTKDEIDAIERSLYGLSGAYSQLNSIEAQQVDWLMEYSKDQDWYAMIPSGALDEFRDGLVAVNDPLKTYGENVAAALEFGAKFASVFADDSGKQMIQYGSELKKGNMSLEEYREKLKEFTDSLEADDATKASIYSFFDSLTDGASRSGEVVDDTTTKIHGLTDAISQLKSGYELLDKAQSEMKDGGGLSIDTVKSIQDSLGEEEKLTDYLYIENGLVKLNTEAWEERARAIALGDIAAIQSRLAELREENRTLLQESRTETDADANAAITERMRQNREEIVSLTKELQIYQSVLDGMVPKDDPLNLSEMFTGIDEVKSQASDFMSAIEDIEEGAFKNWNDLAAKHPELMQVEGLFDIDFVDNQAEAVEVLQQQLDKLDDAFVNVVQAQIDAVQAAKLDAEARGEDTTAYDVLLANLEQLQGYDIREILGYDDAAEGAQEIEKALNGLSSAISNAKSAYSVLDDIAKGEKTDLELLSEVIDLAKKSGEPIQMFISGYDGTKINFNLDVIEDQIDEFLKVVEELEQTNPVKYKGLTEYVKSLIGSGDVEDPLEKLESALGKTEKIISLIKEVAEDGVSLDTIQTLQDLFGEDWEKYLEMDSVGHYTSLATDELWNFIDAENESAGVSSGLKAIYTDAFMAAINGAKEAKSAMDVLSESLKNLQNANDLLKSVRSGDGSIIDMLEQVFEIVNDNDNINLEDLISIDGGLDFNEASIQKYIDSILDYETLIEKYPDLAGKISESMVDAIREAVNAEIQATNETDNLKNSLDELSGAIGNAKDAGDILSSIAAGDKSDLEIFESLISLAEASGKDVWDFIKSFDTDGIHFNTEAIREEMESFLEVVKEVEESDPEKYSGLTNYIKGLIEATEEADTLGDALSKINSAINLVKDTVNNGISMDTINSLRDLFGEDWESYLIQNELGEYIGLDIEKIEQFIEEQKKAGETSVGISTLIAQSWENAGKGVDDAAEQFNKLTEAVSHLQSTWWLLNNIESGNGSFTDSLNQIIDIAKNGNFNLSDLISMDNGAVQFNTEKLREYQASLFSYEALQEVPGMTREMADAFGQLVVQELEAAAASEKFNNALNATSKARGMLDDIRSGNGDFVSMLQNASEMAEQSGQSINDFYTIVDGGAVWSEEAVKQWAFSMIDGLQGVNGITPETIEILKNLATQEMETTSAAERMSTVLTQTQSALEGVANANVTTQVTYDQFKSLVEISTDYAKALEYNNGLITFNKQKYDEVTASVLKANLAEVEAEKQKILTGKTLGELGHTYMDLLSRVGQLDDAEQSELDSLNATIMGYEVLENQLKDTASAYERILGLSEESSGDQYNAAQKAYKIVNDVLYNKDSEDYGKRAWGSFKESAKFFVSPEIDYDSAEFDQAWKNVQRYIEEGAQGTQNFLDDLWANNFIDPTTNTLNAGIEDVASSLGISVDYCRSLFEELGQYFDLKWESPEFDPSSYEEGTEAAENLKGAAKDAQDAIDGIEGSAGSASDAVGDIGTEADNAAANIGDLESRLNTVTESIDNLSSEHKVDIDAQSAVDKLDDVNSRIEKIVGSIGRVVSTPMTINTASAVSNLGRVSSSLSAILSRLNAIASRGTINVNIVETTTKRTVNQAGVSGYGTSAAPGLFGAPGGRTLVGELGREIVVDPNTNTWYTVGDHGAEFINMPEGAIVFDAEQTKQLLSVGRIPGQGLAMLSGNAHAGFLSNTASKVKNKSKQDQVTGNVGKEIKTGSKTSNTGKSKNKKSSGKKNKSENKQDSDLEVFDWIEVAISRVERAISNLSRTASSSFKGLSVRLSATDKEIRQVNDEIAIQQKGYDRYIQQANSVDLSSDLKQQVKSGAIDINEYDKDTQEKIKDYQEWYEKALACSDAIEELHENLAELYSDKFDALEKDFDNQLSGIEHRLAVFNNQLSMSEYSGSAKPFMDMIHAQENSIDIQQKKLNELYSAMVNAVASGEIKEGSEAWYDMQKSIDSVKESIMETQIEVSKLYKDNFDAIEEKFSDRMSLIENAITSYNSTISAAEYTGAIKPFQEIITAQVESASILQDELIGLKGALASAVDSGVIKEGSEAWYDMLNTIESVKESIKQVRIDIAKTFTDSFADIKRQYENAMTIADYAMEYFGKINEASDYTGQTKTYAKMVDMQRDSVRTLSHELAGLEQAMQTALDSGVIQEYSDAWYDMQSQINDVKSKIQDAGIEISKIYKDAFDEIQSRFSSIMTMADHLDKAYSNMISSSEFTGAAKPFSQIIKANMTNISAYESELNGMERALEEAVNSGAIKEGSKAWYEMRSAIEGVKEKIQEMATSTSKVYKDVFDDIERRYNNVFGLIDHAMNYFNGLVSESEFTGIVKPFADMINTTRQNIDVMYLELGQLQQAMDNAVNSGAIKEGSDAWYDMLGSIEAVKEKIKEAGLQIARTYKDAFDETESKFANVIGVVEHAINYINNIMSANTYTGYDQPFAQLIDTQRQHIQVLEAELSALEGSLETAINSGEIKEGSKAWYEMNSAINTVKESIQSTATEISKLYKDSFDAIESKFADVSGLISHGVTQLNNAVSSTTYTGDMKPYAAMIDLQRQNVQALTNELHELQTAMEIAVDSGEIKEGSKAWYEMQDAIHAVEESLQETGIEISRLYQEVFNDIEQRYSKSISLFDNMSKMLKTGLDEIEARGYLGGAELYVEMSNIQKQSIATQEKELRDLEKALDDALDSGEIIEGSDAWYEMQEAILSVRDSIRNANIELINYGNSIRQINWDVFDKMQERIAEIADESNFLIQLMNSSELFDDHGQPTGTGNSQIGLHTLNYDVYMAQADKYADEVKKLNDEIANDAYDNNLITRRNELLKLQRESILAAEQEKDAVRDLVEQGINAELESLSKLITAYKDSLDGAKDLYDYQKNIKSQTQEIASLQKQLSAYAGDKSEENRARVQRIQVDLTDALDKLEETQYERYIADQKKLLDDLYDEYELILNQRLDDIDLLMNEMIAATNQNAAEIRATLNAESAAVGATLSESMANIWSSGPAQAVVSTYGNKMIGELQASNTNVQTMIGELQASNANEGQMISQMTTLDSELVNVNNGVLSLYSNTGMISQQVISTASQTQAAIDRLNAQTSTDASNNTINIIANAIQNANTIKASVDTANTNALGSAGRINADMNAGVAAMKNAIDSANQQNQASGNQIDSDINNRSGEVQQAIDNSSMANQIASQSAANQIGNDIATNSGNIRQALDSANLAVQSSSNQLNANIASSAGAMNQSIQGVGSSTMNAVNGAAAGINAQMAVDSNAVRAAIDAAAVSATQQSAQINSEIAQDAGSVRTAIDNANVQAIISAENLADEIESDVSDLSDAIDNATTALEIQGQASAKDQSVVDLDNDVRENAYTLSKQLEAADENSTSYSKTINDNLIAVTTALGNIASYLDKIANKKEEEVQTTAVPEVQSEPTPVYVQAVAEPQKVEVSTPAVEVDTETKSSGKKSKKSSKSKSGGSSGKSTTTTTTTKTTTKIAGAAIKIGSGGAKPGQQKDKLKGYAEGGYLADLQKVAVANGDDMVTINTLKKGEAVLTPEQAAQFRMLTQNLPQLQGMLDVFKQIDDLRTLNNASLRNEGGVNVGGITVPISIDHVQDYNDFVRQLRDDKTFEKLVTTIVVDPMMGKTKLAKKKYYN